MKNIEVNTMGLTVTVPVPESVDEYNALAPNRDNAVLEDAIKYQILHSSNSQFRTKFVEALVKETGVERINHGTEDEPQWESDGKLFNRMAAKVGQSREDFAASHQKLAQETYDTVKFDPAVRERSSEGPAVGKRDKALAEELVKRGADKVAEVAKLLGEKLGREVGHEVDDLARAFADHRRAKAREVEEATKNELGL